MSSPAYGSMLIRRALASTAPRATGLIRLAVGIIFTSEGVQKFLFPATLGAGRFAKIGIPVPAVMGPFVGGIEILCGALVLAGLLTRLAAIPLLINMIVALVSTKGPILLGQGFWGFSDPSVSKHGLFSMLHEARTDLSMLLSASFLLLVGAGAWSLDAWLYRRLDGDRTGTAP